MAEDDARGIGLLRALLRTGGEDEPSPSELRTLLSRKAPRSFVDVAEHKTKLLHAFEAFGRRHNFATGQLVKWKPDQKIHRRPEYDQPAIVVALIEPPILDSETESGSIYFRQPLDIVLGILDEENTFLIYHYDSRRFEPF